MSKMSVNVAEDDKIRKFVKKELYYAGIAQTIIERTTKKVRVTIVAARPGIIIGKKGADVEKLKDNLKNLVGKDIAVNIKEERKPFLSAQLAAENIGQQLERRVAFRRAMKRVMQNAIKAGAKGIKVSVSGRLGGAEMARTEWYLEGRVPLHTLRARVDYGFAEGHTTYGCIGIKVWIFKGEVLAKGIPAESTTADNKKSKRPRKRGK
jgi:small subunit ribosomal protein S3